jgi:hypothetical protein
VLREVAELDEHDFGNGAALPRAICCCINGSMIDKLPAEDPTRFPASPGAAPEVATLLGWITVSVPAGWHSQTQLASPRSLVRSFLNRHAPPRNLLKYSNTGEASEPIPTFIIHAIRPIL